MSRDATTLGELTTEGVLDLSDGYRTKRSELGLPGVPILRVAEILDGSVAPTFKDHVRADYERAFERKTSRPDDVVLTTKGTVGRVARIGTASPKFVYSPQLCFFRVLDRTRLDAGWLYQWFRGPAFRDQSIQIQDQTDMAAYINLVDLRRTRISVPPLHEQQAIAEVLGALDDKVDANHRLVRLCDETWLAIATRSLRQKTSSVGTVALTSLANFVNGRAFTKGATGTGRMVVRIAELNSGPGGSTVYNDIAVPDPHLVRPGDLLFAWSGSLTVQRWFRAEAIVNQHIFKVVPVPGVPLWLVHAHLVALLDEFRSIAAGKATTMGHIQRRHLDVPVPLPDPNLLAQTDAVCSPLWRRALAAERESLALEALRDALVPPLLSGALRVRDDAGAVAAST